MSRPHVRPGGSVLQSSPRVGGRRGHRWRHEGGRLLWLLWVLVAPGAWAAGGAAGRQAQLKDTVRATVLLEPERHSQAYLERALSRLELLPVVAGPARPTLGALRADLGRGFYDTARVHERACLERMTQLVGQVRVGWQAGRVKEPQALEAVSDLLQALKQASGVALEDARGVLGTEREPKALPRPRGVDPRAWEQAHAALSQAERAWEQAGAQLLLGQEQTAGRHLLTTWEQALKALSTVGVHFRPGQVTDVDGDRVPDQLEVRYGASPLSLDTDEDGLSDYFEMRWGGAELLPASADTDENGVADGLEDSDRDGRTSRQEQAQGTDPLRAETFSLGLGGQGPGAVRVAEAASSKELITLSPSRIASPSSRAKKDEWDSDGDGLEDEAEALYGTPPGQADWGGDGLSDGEELAHATEPGEVDTDGDGFSDGYEVAHLAEGFDPLVPDEKLSPEEWARDYSDGLVIGDACDTLFAGWKPCKSTVPFFLGQLSGGAASFIPVVGWVVGAIADLRDTLGNAVKGEWVGAGLSAVGLVPYVGDVGKLAGRIADFVSRYGKLEVVLRAVLRGLSRVLAAAPGARVLAVGDVGSLGETARKLVLEVLRRVDPKAFVALERYGGEEFVTRLAAWGAKWDDLVLLFTRLEDSGLFKQYPRMQGFIEEMIRTTPPEVLYGGQQLLSLQGRVTLNMKKAALRLKQGPAKYLETVRNHLRAALAEHASLARLTGDEELIRLGHITANGVDRAYRVGKLIDVLEIKAASELGFHNLKNWLRKSVDPKTGRPTYLFNGGRLDEYLRRAGQTRLARLIENKSQLRFNLFIYDEAPRLTPELMELFGSGTRRISIEDFEGSEIILTWTKHWE
jgi:hypothetical protein